MLSIGEFSRATQLSIKALRLYHEKGILIPGKIDVESNYRYYRGSEVEKGAIIKRLKDMGFSLNEIKTIVRECSDDRQMVRHVEEKLKEINRTISEYEKLKETLSLFLEREKEDKKEDKPGHLVEVEKEIIPDMWVCGIRFKGKYEEVGPVISTLYGRCGRYTNGKPFSIYYDGDYKEDGADIEVCVPVKKPVSAEGIECKELKGGNAVTLFHYGPYYELGQSYRRIFEYCREHGLMVRFPTREYYIKGPGMIFKENPHKYVTKLVLFV